MFSEVLAEEGVGAALEQESVGAELEEAGAPPEQAALPGGKPAPAGAFAGALEACQTGDIAAVPCHILRQAFNILKKLSRRK